MMKKRLEMLGPDHKRTVAEHLIDNIMQDALDGKDTQLKLLLNYVEGMPKQSGEIEYKFPESLVGLMLYVKNNPNRPLELPGEDKE